MNMPKLMRLLPMLTMVASLAYATYSMQPVASSTKHQRQARHERLYETASRRQGRPAHECRIPRQGSSLKAPGHTPRSVSGCEQARLG